MFNFNIFSKYIFKNYFCNKKLIIKYKKKKVYKNLII